MVILGFMIAIYFITMLLTAASGIHVYLYSSPGYIGVPQIIIIPSLLFYMKQVNIAKKFIRLINPCYYYFIHKDNCIFSNTSVICCLDAMYI